MKRKPILPRVQWHRRDQRGLSLKRFWLPNHEAFHVAESRSVEVLGPIKPGSFRREFGTFPRVVRLLDFFIRRQRSMWLRNRILKLKNASCPGIRIGEAGQL